MSKSHSHGDAPPSYTAVTNAAVHQSWEQAGHNNAGPSQGFSGLTSHSQYPKAGPSTSHSGPGSSHHHHHHNGQTASSEGGELPHFTYHTVQGGPVAVQGGYQYSSTQGMAPIQAAPGYQPTTPFACDRTERLAAIRRKKLEKKCYLRVAVVLGVVTVIALIIAFVLRNSMIIGYHTP